jgi:hypothetical protein
MIKILQIYFVPPPFILLVQYPCRNLDCLSAFFVRTITSALFDGLPEFFDLEFKQGRLLGVQSSPIFELYFEGAGLFGPLAEGSAGIPGGNDSEDRKDSGCD